MVSINFNSLCKEAELYYYDLLSNKGGEVVPEFATDHIKQCKYCQEQISRLSHMLSVTKGHIEPERGQSSSPIMLKLHLAYIGKPVTCETIKPFLPSFSDPALRISIPTPITVHLDNCQKCSEDLQTIQTLNLSRRQLHRLSQLFTDKSVESKISCKEAQKIIPSVVSIVFSEIDTENLRHVCVCPDCRRLVYQRRENVLMGLQKTGLVENKLPCEKISTRDFFDYAIPYGFDTTSDQYAKFRESLISHLRTCPTCLAKMQKLHQTIYGIYERPKSEIVTVYHLDESMKAQTLEQPNASYAGFPIKVDINKPKEAGIESYSPTGGFGTVLKQKASVSHLKPLLKFTAAAAAVISIAAVLLLNVPTAKAVTLSQIYKAVEGLKNVYISKFAPDKTKPIQQIWVSRTLHIYMTKTGEQQTLWDIKKEEVKIKRPGVSEAETTRLSAENIADIKNKVNGHLGLVPFTYISEIPINAQWSRVIDNNLKTAYQDTEIYDLLWTETSVEGSVTFKRWRFFVNPQTDLPKRTEFSEKLPTDDDYVLESINVVEYLNDAEMQAAVKKASF